MKLAVFASVAAGLVHAADNTNPMTKVIQLLEDLKKENEDIKTEEDAAYGAYASFCKDNTDTLSEKITKGSAEIEKQASEYEKQTATAAEQKAEMETQRAEKEAKTAELAEKTADYEATNQELVAKIADNESAIRAIEGALRAVRKGRPSSSEDSGDSVSFIQTTVEKYTKMAEAMGISQLPYDKAEDGKKAYTTQTEGVETLLKGLETTFSDKNTEDNNLKEATKVAFFGDLTANPKITGTKPSLESLIVDAKTAEGDAKTAMDTATTLAGDAKENLIKEKKTLKENNTALVALTKSCELEARTYDQRSAMRAGEETALDKALEILEGANSQKRRDALEGKRTRKAAEYDDSTYEPSDEAKGAAEFFLQTKAETKRANLLTSAKMQRVRNVIDMVRSAAQKLKSVHLFNSFMQLDSAAKEKDTFKKVKDLIQKLIQRLIQQATDEATSKGMCDMQTAKAEKQREHRLADVNSLNLDLEELEIAIENNNNTIDTQTTLKEETDKALHKLRSLRDEDKEINKETIEESKKGFTAVDEAIKVLKEFYAKAGNHNFQKRGDITLLQQPQAGPGAVTGASGELVYEGATTGGSAYRGNQDGSTTVISLLDEISRRFHKMHDDTITEEKEAHAEFKATEQEYVATIAGCNTKLELENADLKENKATETVKHEELSTNMGLVDDAVKTLVTLNGLCVDTGMTYEERKEKREKEIDALKSAFGQLCIAPDCTETIE